MKHIIPLAICTVAVAALVPAAVSAHHSYVHQITLQNARQEASQAKVRVQAALAAHKQAEATEAELNNLQKNCQGGLNAYGLLTTAQKQNAVKPDCSL